MQEASRTPLSQLGVQEASISLYHNWAYRKPVEHPYHNWGMQEASRNFFSQLGIQETSRTPFITRGQAGSQLTHPPLPHGTRTQVPIGDFALVVAPVEAERVPNDPL